MRGIGYRQLLFDQRRAVSFGSSSEELSGAKKLRTDPLKQSKTEANAEENKNESY
jgi:hypothetical protein